MDTTLDMTLADALADWCKLEVEEFRKLYGNAIRGTEATQWPVLVAQAPNSPTSPTTIAGLRRSACREALKAQVFLELAVRLSQVQLAFGLTDKNDADQIVTKVTNGLVGGHMQALVQDGALLNRETLEGTLAVDDATALVRSGTQLVGTAFLVGPDLVLTAAHVVLRDNGSAFEAVTRQELSFTFRASKGGTGNEAVKAYPAARDPLVACSVPWGKPPNQLFVSPQPDAARMLDFALVRLDREVTHVKSLDIKSPPMPEAARPLVVLGYPGGTAMAWDKGIVSVVQAERLEHKANTLAGMSGSCCINIEGRPVALHEGSLVDKTYSIGGHKGSNGSNRAICLWHIRNAMPAGAADPLASRARSSPLAFHDESMVRKWAMAGLRFAPENYHDNWVKFVKSAIGRTPEEAGGVPSFHPWFRREGFEKWADDNNIAGPSRLCVVRGDSGAGKSFLASILRERIPDNMNDVVVISATETTAWSWRDAIQKWGVPIGGAGALRPEAGVAMHDEAPKAAALIAQYGDRSSPATAKPLFVVIDFDGNASFPLDEEPWLPFMRELLGNPWVRLVVIGAPESVVDNLTDLMQDEELGEVVRIVVGHIDQAGFREFARKLLLKGGKETPEKKAQLEEALSARTRILQAFPVQQLQTAATVLAGIMLQNSLGS